ncbi:MAG: hypothetical protein HYU99_01830 [Deltaproteobacteria bacterium]|nr:hypothetical protein [Deltaproteobacteria bacterium]
MDPIIGKLNRVATEKIKGASQGKVGAPETSFKQTLDQTMTDKLIEKMRETYAGSAPNEMTAVSAENIKVTTAGPEMGTTNAEGTDQFFQTFKEMNKDLLSLDSALETLTTPGLKLSPQQLLAMQAGIANTTLMAEAFSRFTDSVARGIQTIVQTQVG